MAPTKWVDARDTHTEIGSGRIDIRLMDRYIDTFRKTIPAVARFADPKTCINSVPCSAVVQ